MKKTLRTLLNGLATRILLCLAAATVGTASAATLTVSNTLDNGAGSLRAAIANAGPGTIINFAASLSGQTITLTSGQLLIRSNLTIDASALANRVTISGNNASRVLMVTNNVTVVLKSLSINSGRVSDGFGAGIYNSAGCALTLTNCLVQQNSVIGGDALGGGIYNAGTLTLTECTVASNSTLSGGGSYGGGEGGDSKGGGIYNVGNVTLNRNTLSSNDAVGGGGAGTGTVIPAGHGGAAFGGGLCNEGSATLNQNTFGLNTARGGNGGNGSSGFFGGAPGHGGNSYGGGIYSTGLLTCAQNTLATNYSYEAAGGNGGGANGAFLGAGIYNTAAGTDFVVRNCLIAPNFAESVTFVQTNSDVFGAFFSQGHNLVGATNSSTGFTAAGDLKGSAASPLDPLLGPLSSRGGPTLTFAPQPGSPAIEAGDDSVTNSFATDQRGTGFPRRAGTHVDIGSYEVQPGSAPFLASGSAGSVTLDPVTQLGSVNVSASVNPNSYQVPATVWVQYGPNPSYGQATTPQVLSAGITYTFVSGSLINLAPGLTWHYRWAAANNYGTSFSADQLVSVGPQLYAQGQSDVINFPNTYGLYTLTQYTTNGATNFVLGRNTGRSDVTNAPNTYGLYTLTQYNTNFTFGRNTGRGDVTNAPNTYGLYTLTQYNTNFTFGRNTGRGDVTNAPNTYGLYTLTQYNTNFTFGRNTGRGDVTNAPNTYGLFTLSQYNTNGVTNFTAGVATVTNAPNTFSLYTLTQYTTNGATNFVAGRNTGRSDVTNAPNTFSLYTLTQYTTNGATNFAAGRNTGRSDVTNAPNSYGLYTLTQYNTNFTFGRNTGRSDVTNSPNTYGLYAVTQLQALNVSAPLLTKNPTNGMFMLTIGVQRATQLTNFALFPMNSAGFTNSINAAGKLEFNFGATTNVSFFRLQSQ